MLDRFRKPAGNPLLEELTRLYALVRKRPHEPSIMDDWWEGRADGETIAVQDRGGGIIVYAGDIVEVTGICLVRIAPGSSGPAGNSPQRLDRIVGAQGAALASRFVLAAHPRGDFDHPQLRLPALRDGIPRLSPSVQEVSVYENDRGLSLLLDQTATRETVVADLDLALAMVRGVEGVRGLSRPSAGSFVAPPVRQSSPMARTKQAEYNRSNRQPTLAIPDPDAAGRAARAVLAAPDATSRQATGQRLLDLLAAETGIPTPELVVPDAQQPHRRSGGRIVYSLQGDYRRRQPSPADPTVARGGRPIGRIRVLHRTPARGAIVRPSAFLHTLLHEFCHHHDAEALGLLRSFHTAGFYARLRHLRGQIDGALDDRAAPGAPATPAAARARRRSPGPRAPNRRRPARRAAGPMEQLVLPFLDRLWSIIRGR